MQLITLHNLTARSKTKAKKRVGRGNASGKGTYSTRGIKGQNSRSGGSKGLFQRSIMKQLIKKTPKLGGFKSMISKNKRPRPISLELLANKFDSDQEITHEALIKKGIISKDEARFGIKIVGSVALTKKLTVQQGIAISKNAAIEIKKAGGMLL